MNKSSLLSSQSHNFADFLLRRGLDGCNPHPLFDVEYYLSQRSDLVTVLRSNWEVMLHYLEYGAREGVNPHPLFDTRFYLKQCAEIDGAAASPLGHFLTQGWRMRLDPHPMFSVSYYLQRHPEVAKSGLNPVLHCLGLGIAQQKDLSPWFDGDYYLAANPDIAQSGWGPLDHFLRFGIAEGRAGSPFAANMQAMRPEFVRPFGLRDLAYETHQSSSWARFAGPLSPSQLKAAAKEASGFNYRPAVSLLLHVSAENEQGFAATLCSIQEQVYSNWQLCVVTDPQTSIGLRQKITSLSAAGRAVTLVQRGWSGDEAFALNAALDTAAGEFVGFVHAGDQLHQQALSALVSSMQGEARCDVVYGDEDTVDDQGVHDNMFYKPGWSPEYLLGCDYLSRLGLYRTQMVRDLGGLRPSFDAGCIHDLSLRISRTLSDPSIKHVTKVIYHKKPNITGVRQASVRQDGIHRAVAAFLDSEGLNGQIVRTETDDRFRVTLTNRSDPLVSIIIPTGNASFAGPLGKEWVLTNCTRSIIKNTIYKNVEIIVVHDGNLLPDQAAKLRADGVELVANQDPAFNFSRKINQAARLARGSYILLLNDDVEAKRPDWLNILLAHAERPGVGVVGPKLFFPDGRLQHTGIIMQQGNPGHLYYRADGCDAGLYGINDMTRNVLAVTGACQLINRATFDAVGGYDEALPLNFNDVDFCLRVRELGERIVYAAAAELYHFEGVSKEMLLGHQMTMPTETAMFQARWRPRIAEDPFYHPELPANMPLGWKPLGAVRRTPSQARTVPGFEKTEVTGVNFFGATNRSSGLGTASRGYISSIQASGLATRIINLDKVYGHQSVVQHELVSTSQDFPISLVLANADATPAAFLNYGDELQNATYRVGVWVWELPAIRPEWLEMIDKYDEIWVPSQFCYDAFKPMTKKPVSIVPYAVSRLPNFTADESALFREQYGIPRDSFVYLYMFDTYSFVDRKNPTCLLDAFEAEFCNADDVTLVLKISYFDNLNSNYSKGNFDFKVRLDQFLDRCRNVIIVSETLSERDVYQLINAADCYVSPHRSEGFGLTIAEAMYYGKAVISTDYSGPRDLIKDETGLKLKYSLVELPDSMGPYSKGNIWAAPSLDHLRELMCRVRDDGDLRARIGLAAQKFVARHFSSKVIGSIAAKQLRRISGNL